MLLIVVPAGLEGVGFGDGVGDGLEPPDEEFGGEPGGELVEFEGVGEVLETPGTGSEAVAVAVPVLVGTEAVPPHPAIATRTVPASPIFKSVWGTERISQF